jgi:SAM-dependent methyltransferase
MVIEVDLLRLIHCPVCEGSNTKDIFNLESPYVEQLFYRILKCNDCAHQYAVGPVTEKILSEVYGAAFHSSSQQQADNSLSPVIVNAVRRTQWLHKCGLQGRLLDVGAGRGYFVQAAQECFDACGIDYSPDALRYGEFLGVVIKSGDFTQTPYESGSFDVLTFWDVLASMADVRSTMARAAKLLRPRGYVALTVPMSDSLACRLGGRRWPLWIPPVNLHYFSKQSLEKLLRECGFEIIRIECQGKKVSITFLLVKFARIFNLRSLERLVAKLPFHQAVLVNFGDIQTILARKL